MKRGRRAAERTTAARGVTSGDPPPAPTGWRPLLREAGLVLALVALAVWVHRAAAGRYFSPDDLIYLERVRGIVPDPPGLWRWLSGVVWFRVVFPWFGAAPQPYLVANLALHGACVAALYVFARSLGGGVLAATVAAGLFGVSRLHMTALSQAVTVAEPLSLLLALAAMSAARRPGPYWALAALAAFTAALLSKEAVLLLPLLLLLPDPSAGLRTRALRCTLLLAPSILITAYMSDPRIHAAIFVNDVYQRAYGANLFHNLMTLGDWALDFQTPVPDLAAAISTGAWRTALWPLAALAVLAAVAWRSTRLPAIGVGWWLLTLAPVLPLIQQRYLHYLYIPLAGLALAIGGTLEWAAGVRRRAPSAAAPHVAIRVVAAWLVAIALVVGYAGLSSALLTRRATERIERVDLPLDPFLRKSEMARRAIEGVGRSMAGRHGDAVVVIPEAGWTRALAGVLHSVLGEGRALRAVHPNIDSVALVPRWTADYEDFELIYGRYDGHFVALGFGPVAHMELTTLMVQDGCLEDARVHAATVAAAYPDDARLRAIDVRVRAIAGGSGSRTAEPRIGAPIRRAGHAVPVQ